MRLDTVDMMDTVDRMDGVDRIKCESVKFLECPLCRRIANRIRLPSIVRRPRSYPH